MSRILNEQIAAITALPKKTGEGRSLRNVTVGERYRISPFVNMYDCVLGDDVSVGPFVEIQKGVVIGNRCKIQSHSFLCEGVELGDRVFIGHGVMFTNDREPRSCGADGELLKAGEWELKKTIVRSSVSIGTGAVILPGIEIGENAMIGAGAVVTKNVPANTVVAGVPARVIRQL